MRKREGVSAEGRPSGPAMVAAQSEGWNVLDSLYFSVTTLTTVGLGDLTPTNDSSKIFTIIYILVGLGVLVAFVTAMGEKLLRAERDKHADRGAGSS